MRSACRLPALEDCFRQALGKHGIPRMVYRGNGLDFRATRLRKMAARLRVESVFATPYSSEGSGKIERFFGVFKARFYSEGKAAGLATLDELDRFDLGEVKIVHRGERVLPREAPYAPASEAPSGISLAGCC